jgi:hypothetical protein
MKVPLVLVTFLVSMTREKLMEGRIDLGSWFQWCQSIMVGRVWWDRVEHIIVDRRRGKKRGQDGSRARYSPQEHASHDLLPPTRLHPLFHHLP